MPQPLSTFKKTPQQFQIARPSVHVFEHSPQLATFEFEALVSWTRIEAHLFDLFVSIMGGPESELIKSYPSLGTLAAKYDYVCPHAQSKLSEIELAIFSELLKRVESFSKKKRNKLAHLSWGTAKNFPDAYLLVKLGVFILDNIDHKKVMVYRKIDFIEIVDDNDELTKSIRHFESILRCPSESNDKLLHLLFERLEL